jgi:glycosyltransferase involved in cell wall biosynthesis
MHVGLNAQLLSLDHTYRGAGINTYINCLLHALGQIDSPHHFTVFLSERRFRSERLALRHTAWPMQRPWVRISWEQMALPMALRQGRMNLLHAMAFVAPLLVPCPYVLTVFDLSFLRFREAFRPFNRWYLSHLTPISVRRARRVIAISESTRQDLVRWLGVSPERVDVTTCGVDSAYRPLAADMVNRYRRDHCLPDKFVLFVGTLEPRKNVELLIRAYGRWRTGHRDVPSLVVAGAKGWNYEQVFRTVEELGLADHVHFPGYVVAEELPMLYNAAGLFVYPSRFEGFGLPVLEAMACGTPVVCSNASSLPEVAGDAALLVAPGDEARLADAMTSVWEDRDLRQTMVARGLDRAREFTWERTARQTLRSYERALEA